MTTFVMGNCTQTLAWIVGLLKSLDVRFQIVGGLAAKAYGAKRPLADLDFYVPAARLEEIARAAAPYLVRSPSHHRDEFWDLVFMKLVHKGQEVELAGAEGARFFDRLAGRWCDAEINFDASVECRILGVTVPIMPVEQLVAYKRALARDVDQQDVTEIVCIPRHSARPPETTS